MEESICSFQSPVLLCCLYLDVCQIKDPDNFENFNRNVSDFFMEMFPSQNVFWEGSTKYISMAEKGDTDWRDCFYIEYLKFVIPKDTIFPSRKIFFLSLFFLLMNGIFSISCPVPSGDATIPRD